LVTHYKFLKREIAIVELVVYKCFYDLNVGGAAVRIN